MLSLWRKTASPTLGRVLAISGAVTATLFSVCATPAAAQDTVYVGGSGQQSVEVNLDVLNNLPSTGSGRQLLHPGEKPLYLRRPLLEPGSSIVRVPAPSVRAPQATPTPLAAPPAPAPYAAPVRAPVQAPAVAQLPVKPASPVQRAAPVPLRPMPVAPPPMPSTNAQKRLTELAALRNEDLITESDFAAKRAEILGQKSPAPIAPPPSVPAMGRKAPSVSAGNQKRLDELTALWDQDLITEADYNKKRAAILGVPAESVEPPASAPSAPEPIKKAAALEPVVSPAPTKAPVQMQVLKKAEPAKQEMKIAALPKRPPPIDGTRQLRLDFESAVSNLTPAQTGQLTDLAGRLKGSDTRLQVRAYAGATGDDKGSARRSSLKRALAVRSRLIEGGIRSTRIDVRALGVAGDDGPADRVDIYSVIR